MWQCVAVVLLITVVYDQGMSSLTVVDAALLTSCLWSVVYLKRKGSIPGPRFKIPLVGPFLQAIDPKFEAYLKQWASGPLSCVSIFHK